MYLPSCALVMFGSASEGLGDCTMHPWSLGSLLRTLHLQSLLPVFGTMDFWKTSEHDWSTCLDDYRWKIYCEVKPWVLHRWKDPQMKRTQFYSFICYIKGPILSNCSAAMQPSDREGKFCYLEEASVTGMEHTPHQHGWICVVEWWKRFSTRMFNISRSSFNKDQMWQRQVTSMNWQNLHLIWKLITLFSNYVSFVVYTLVFEVL